MIKMKKLMFVMLLTMLGMVITSNAQNPGDLITSINNDYLLENQINIKVKNHIIYNVNFEVKYKGSIDANKITRLYYNKMAIMRKFKTSNVSNIFKTNRITIKQDYLRTNITYKIFATVDRINKTVKFETKLVYRSETMNRITNYKHKLIVNDKPVCKDNYTKISHSNVSKYSNTDIHYDNKGNPYINNTTIPSKYNTVTVTHIEQKRRSRAIASAILLGSGVVTCIIGVVAPPVLILSGACFIAANVTLYSSIIIVEPNQTVIAPEYEKYN